MPSYTTPGVYIQEQALPNLIEGSSRAFQAAFLGTSAQGPTTPTLIESWTTYQRLFGGFPTAQQAATELPYAVFNYFANGGRSCWVSRVVGTGAATSTLALVDRAATSQNTLAVSARSPGAWGNQLYVEIKDRDSAAGRFDLIVYLGGTTDSYVVERFTDLSIDSADTNWALGRVNSVSNGSQYITVANSGSGTAFPNNAPKVISPTVLSSGAAGSVPNNAQVQAAISGFDDVTGPILLNLPGNGTTAVINSAITYAEQRGDVFVLVDSPVGSDVSAVVSYTSGLSPASSYAAVYYPWVYMVDPTGGSGALRLTPPGSAVAGVIVTTDASRGPFKAPAGTQALLSGAVQLERKLTDADLGTLNTSHVNAIRNLPGTGIAVMGARTLKKTSIDRYIPARRSLIYLRERFKDVTAFAAFEPNDQALWSSMAVRLAQVCSEYWRIGGLRGSTANEAYFVKCDAELNTPAVVASGEVRAQVGVALQAPAEFVVITIGQYDGGAIAADNA